MIFTRSVQNKNGEKDDDGYFNLIEEWIAESDCKDLQLAIQPAYETGFGDISDGFCYPCRGEEIERAYKNFGKFTFQKTPKNILSNLS